jgi:hypothetical protein
MAYSSASPEQPILKFYIEIVDLAKKLFNQSGIGQRDGLFYSFGIALVGMTAGLFSPLAAIILGIVCIIITSMLGLNSIFTISTITLLCIFGIIIGLRVRQ